MAHDDTSGFDETHNYTGGQSAAHESSAGAAVFSEAEQQRFWRDDREAATFVVGLLAGIFTIGLLGYICVSLWVAYG